MNNNAQRGKLAQYLGSVAYAEFVLTSETRRLPCGAYLQLARDVRLDIGSDRSRITYSHLWLEVEQPLLLPEFYSSSIAFCTIIRYTKADGSQSYGLAITKYDDNTPSPAEAFHFLRLVSQCLSANKKCYLTYNPEARRQSSRHQTELSRFRQIATQANRDFIREQLPRMQRLIANMKSQKCFMADLPLTIDKQIEMFSNICEGGWKLLSIVDADAMYRQKADTAKVGRKCKGDRKVARGFGKG